jgi:RNA polymerase sigma-70 factor, ECF subfamily
MQAAGTQPSAADAAVVEALRQGDEQAFARLVDQLHASLRRMARLYVSSPAIADEVVQDTWLAVIQGVWAFEGRSSLKTWIFRILINRAKTRAVREGRTLQFVDAEADDLEAPERPVDSAHTGSDATDPGSSGRRAVASHTRRPVEADASLRDPGPSPEARLLTQEARRQIQAALESLPTSQRIVITMRDLEGCSSEEVCNVLGLTETNQRVILHRARARVRAMLKDYLQEP